MNNRKGFTLIELLVTITIIGIIMIMTLPAIHNLQRENQKKKFDDYERAVLEAAKAYEDQYEEDLFGRSDTGCASINYEDLVNKKLLTTTKIAGYECNNDKNGIIIRKVKGTSYYEVYLTCNKGNNDTKNLTGNNDDFNNIKSNHCNTGEDHDPPILTIKCDGDNDNAPAHGAQGDDFQTTHIYYYSATNDGEKRIPELTVQASDNITGLEKNQYVTYEWKIYNEIGNLTSNIPNKIEKNKTTFNTKDGAGSTAKKKVRIIEEFKRANTTGKAVVDLSGENIIDRAGNKLSLEADSATKTCQYFYDNAKPQMEIRITGNNTGTSYDTNSEYWINEPITTTVTVTDVTGNGIYSGIEPSSLTRGNVNEQLTGGMETYTFTKEDSNRKEDDEYISTLSVTYSNMPVLVLAVMNYTKLFSKKIVSMIVCSFIIAAVVYILSAYGKRGPILWSFISIVSCFFIKSTSIKKLVLFWGIIIAAFFIFMDPILDIVKEELPKTGRKLELSLKEGNTSGRFDTDDPKHSTYLIGLENFSRSPIWGYYFRLVTDYKHYQGVYAHNVFIEILMTMGLLGFVPFMLLLLKVYFKSRKYFSHSYLPNQLAFFALFVCAFLQLQTTGSCVFSNDFWLFLYILCCMDAICAYSSVIRPTSSDIEESIENRRNICF